MDPQELERIGWKKIAFGYIPMALGIVFVFFEVYSALSSTIDASPIPPLVTGVFVLVGWLGLKFA